MGLFGSTRYRHFHSQSVSSLNSGYLADPINTYAATGLVKGQDSASSVLNGVRSGMGLQLKQYYQYSTLRFKNRNFNSNFYRTSFRSTEGIRPNIKMFTNSVPENSQLNDIYSRFNISSAYHYYWLQQKYGLDYFNNQYNGYPISLSSLINLKDVSVNSSGKSWIIGYIDIPNISIENRTPVIILHPEDSNNPNLVINYNNVFILDITEYSPKESVGISYFTSSVEPKVITETSEELESRAETFNKKYPNKKVGDRFLISRESNWKIDIEESYKTSEELSNKDNVFINNVNDENKEIIIEKYIIVTDKVFSGTTLTSTVKYKVITVTTTISYDTEHFLYELINGESNSEGLSTKLSLFNKTLSSENKAKLSKLFKFYPYIPVRECDNLWRDYAFNIFDFSQSNLINLTKEFNKERDESLGISKENPKPRRKGLLNVSNLNKAMLLDLAKDMNLTDTSDENLRLLAEYQSKEENKKKSYEDWLKERNKLRDLHDLESDTNNSRNFSKANKITSRLNSGRKLNRESKNIRKIKVNDNRQHIKKMSNGSLKRHLYKMGNLLNIDLNQTVSSILADNSSGYLKRIYLMPSVTLNSNHNDVIYYWWEFFNRIYKSLEDGGLFEWNGSVQNAIFDKDLSIFNIEYKNVANTYSGNIGFCFIKKFEINGKIRNIKGKRDIYEIRRGKPRINVTIEDLKNNIEPINELANDSYYTSRQGKQWNIGGDPSFNGIGANETNPIPLILGKYNYTYICKDIGNGKLSVIAIAGLVGRTDIGYSRAFWGSAWYDLELSYIRNRNKYINNKNDPVVFENAYRESKRHYHNHRIETFFNVPLDFNTIKIMGAINLERFSQRSVTIYIWNAQESKFKAGWVARLVKIVGFIVAVVATIFTGGFDGGMTGAAILTATVKAVATAIVTQLVIKNVILPLLKALGIKGVLAIIVMIVVAIIATYVSGYNPNLASLPYASQTATTNIASTAVKESLSSTIFNVFKDSLDMTLREGLTSALFVSMDAYQNIVNSEISDINAKMQEDNNRYMKHLKELEEKQSEIENRNASYDSILVLKEIQHSMIVEDPETMLHKYMDTLDLASSYQYLESFLSMKLDLNPNTFNPVNSLDFSLPLKPNT